MLPEQPRGTFRLAVTSIRKVKPLLRKIEQVRLVGGVRGARRKVEGFGRAVEIIVLLGHGVEFPFLVHPERVTASMVDSFQTHLAKTGASCVRCRAKTKYNLRIVPRKP